MLRQEILKQFKIYDINTKTDAQRLAQVNPNYSSGKYEWTHNCQRCIVAWELLQRGYNVTAKPLAHDLIGDSLSPAWKFKNEKWYQDTDVRIIETKAGFKQKIDAAFQSWGSDARAMVVVTWKNGEKHAFTARYLGDRIVYEDPQLGTLRDIDGTLAACSSKQETLFFARIDNRDFTEAVLDAVQNVEE